MKRAAAIRRLAGRFGRSIWLFPAVLTVALAVLTALQISGSSMGVYHAMFYGNGSKDPALLWNQPLGIRSDEWLVNTQMTLAQRSNNFARFNPNIGNGEDLSLMVDAPYKDWSMVFKPHNLAFFVMPFANAFAFRWWFIGYLLVLGGYFFVLALLPGRRLLAAALGLALVCNPFVQWWYLYGTLGSLAYCLLGGVILIKILEQPDWRRQLAWSALLAYVAVCFALMLYPPFQLACGLAMAAFAGGYLVEKLRRGPRRAVAQSLGMLVGAMAVAGLVTGAYLATRADVVSTVTHTAYPGNRLQASGGFDPVHLLASHLQVQLQKLEHAGYYHIGGQGTNQSEASNFVLLLPFLVVPSAWLLYRRWRAGQGWDWPLVAVNGLFLVLLLWLFVPHLGLLGKVLLLNRVPHGRLLIGLGLLNFLQLVLFVRAYGRTRGRIAWKPALLYAAIVLIVELAVGFDIMHQSPGFIGAKRVIAFALPLPVVVYWLWRKRFVWAGIGLLGFVAVMGVHVNPLYRGTAILDQTPVSAAIREVAARDRSAEWATEYFPLENFVAMNGAHSLSGVYTYPQLGLWHDADPTAHEAIYNRYEHTSFHFDRDPARTIPTKLKLLSFDNMAIETEPCSDFLRRHRVRYLLTAAQFEPAESCVSLVKRIAYPAVTFYVYRIQ